jgi:Tfp pilus assembly protein PilN
MQRFLTIDCSFKKISIAEFVHRNHSFHLQKSVEQNLPCNLNEITDLFDCISKILKDFKTIHYFQQAPVILGFSDGLIWGKCIDLSDQTNKKNLEQYLPLPSAEMIYNSRLLQSGNSALLVGIRKDHVESVCAAIHSVFGEILSIEISPLADLNHFLKNSLNSSPKTFWWIDIRESTVFLIFWNEALGFFKTIPKPLFSSKDIFISGISGEIDRFRPMQKFADEIIISCTGNTDTQKPINESFRQSFTSNVTFLTTYSELSNRHQSLAIGLNVNLFKDLTLLPAAIKKFKFFKNLESFLLTATALWIAVVAVISLFVGIEKLELNEVVQTNKLIIDRFTALSKESEALQKKLQTAKKNSEIQQTAFHNQRKFLKLLNDICSICPSGIWITRLEITHLNNSKALDISGHAFAAQEKDSRQSILALKNSFSDLPWTTSIQDLSKNDPSDIEYAPAFHFIIHFLQP